MSDIFSYSDSDNNLGLSADNKDESETGPSGSTDHLRPSDETNMKINQGNYLNSLW